MLLQVNPIDGVVRDHIAPEWDNRGMMNVGTFAPGCIEFQQGGEPGKSGKKQEAAHEDCTQRNEQGE